MIKTLLFGLLAAFTSKYSSDHKIFPPLFFFYEYFDTSPPVGKYSHSSKRLKTWLLFPTYDTFEVSGSGFLDVVFTSPCAKID